MSTLTASQISRMLWRKQGTMLSWLFDAASYCDSHCQSISTLCRRARVVPNTCSSPATRLHSFSSSATFPVRYTPETGICWARISHRRAARASNYRRHSKSPKPAELRELIRRLTQLNIHKVTSDDLKTIWDLFQNEAKRPNCQLHQVSPPLVTMLYRLVSEKGTIDMIDTLHHQLVVERGISATIEDMEWVIFANIKANRVERAHQLLSDLYAAGKTPTKWTYRHLIKAEAKHFYDIDRRKRAEILLNEMNRRGLCPDSNTYLQFLMGLALYCPDKDLMMTWFRRFMDLEAEHGWKRTQQRVKLLVEMMASHGHPSTFAVFSDALDDAGLSFDVDTWNKTIRGCLYAGDFDAAEELLERLRKREDTKPNLETYHTLMRGYLCQLPLSPNHRPRRQVVDLDAAIRLFQRMCDDGLSANLAIYESFFTAYTSYQMADDEQLRIETLRRLWQVALNSVVIVDHDKEDSDKNNLLHDDILPSLFQFYMRHDVLNEAEQLYWALRQHRYPLSRRLLGEINSLIVAFAKRRHLPSALSLTYDFLAAGHWPSRRTVLAVIRCCSARGDLDSAKQLLDIMEEIRSQDPSSSSYISPVCYELLARERARTDRAAGGNIPATHCDK